jgi:transposase
MQTNRQQNCESQSQRVLANVILLGLDVHAESITVVRQIEGGMPQPPQKLAPAQFLEWARRQQPQAREVWSCYEAGPFGYQLHRQLEVLGIHNVVVCPKNWDELHTGVKTDKTDARALCERLALYVAGNRRIFSVVNVPTPEQEQSRAQSRLRDQLRRDRARVEAQGRSLLLNQGYHIKGRWWSPRHWPQLSLTLPDWLVKLLEPLRQCIITAHQQTLSLTQAVKAAATPTLPLGLGALTSQVIEREIGDWGRFHNRRQIASYTGLCPGEHSSGASRRLGPVTKHGNPRLRHILIEATWRLLDYQPDYRPVQRWSRVFNAPTRNPAARKKAVVAIARQLAVDLWRLRTGRVLPQTLGLRLNPNPEACN